MPSPGPTPPLALIVDPREPWPHPWRPWAPAGVEFVRQPLEAGRLALAGAEGGAVVDRKSISELLVSIGPDREAFQAELKRGRTAGSYLVVIEGTLEQLIAEAPRIRPTAILGTLAAWSRRFGAPVFCGSRELAAAFAFRALIQPYHEARRSIAAIEAGGRTATEPDIPDTFTRAREHVSSDR